MASTKILELLSYGGGRGRGGRKCVNTIADPLRTSQVTHQWVISVVESISALKPRLSDVIGYPRLPQQILQVIDSLQRRSILNNMAGPVVSYPQSAEISGTGLDL